ncbi:MAG: N-acetyl-gamma-glutamyl-phosphate reductase [Mariprofundaceae bacterium]
MEPIEVAILGATGYTGAELIRLLARHPCFRIRHLAAHSQAGRLTGDVLPGIAGEAAGLRLAESEAPLPEGVRLAFTALPHAAAAASVKRLLDAGVRVVDLSADFRHRDPARYEAAYGIRHPHPELLAEAVYGLTEHSRAALDAARLVANPGCYPTSVLLPLVPLLQAGVIDDPIIIDAKSGASGAGRGAKTELLYCEINESLRAYGLPRHRHAFEMEDGFAALGGRAMRALFTPHIRPMTRGMLSTLHLCGREASRWHGILAERYADEPFVRVLPEGRLPASGDVAGSNRCDIGIAPLDADRAVVVSCIDNLLKGASGQAVQNANRMFGLPEGTGLPVDAQWP